MMSSTLIKIFSVCIMLTYWLSFFSQALGQKKLKIRVVATENKLLQYKENGINKGSTIDILNILLKENNIETTIEYMPWARAYRIAETTPNTIILSMVKTKEREKKFHWIGIVSQLSRVFISLKDNPEAFVENIEQAKHKIVAVSRNGFSQNELIKQGFIVGKNLYVVSSMEQGFNLLLKGKVELIYYDPEVIKRYIFNKKQDVNEISYAPITAKDQRTSYIAINKDSDPFLVKKLMFTMAKFSQTEKYRILLKQ